MPISQFSRDVLAACRSLKAGRYPQSPVMDIYTLSVLSAAMRIVGITPPRNAPGTQ